MAEEIPPTTPSMPSTSSTPSVPATPDMPDIADPKPDRKVGSQITLDEFDDFMDVEDEMEEWDGLLVEPPLCEKCKVVGWASVGILVVAVVAMISFYKDCLDAKSKNQLKPHIRISPDSGPLFVVACNQLESGGGWTIIQRRSSKLINFDRNWRQYSEGFGNLTHNFWLGNAHLHRLTYNRSQMLFMKVSGLKGEIKARYKTFSVGSMADFYRLKIGGYVGSNTTDQMKYHNNQQFSAFNLDKDSAPDYHCAARHCGGWWYNKCGTVYLNTPWGKTMRIYQSPQGNFFIPTSTLMMVRHN